jgi:hypothetical protein
MTMIMMDEVEEVVYITFALKTGYLKHANIPELVQSTAHV